MEAGSNEFFELYRSFGHPEAMVLAVLLEAEGVEVRIDNAALQGAFGELPLGWSTAPRIMVAQRDSSVAKAVLAKFLSRPKSTPSNLRGDIDCLACGSSMKLASVCPECGWSYLNPGSDDPESTEP